MNKAKKITAIAVSLVMAGTMAVSLAACDPTDVPGPGPGPETNAGPLATPEKVASLLKKIAPQYETLNNSVWEELYSYYTHKDASSQSNTVKNLTYTNGTTVRVALGYKDDTTAISFSQKSLPLAGTGDTTTSIVMPDGKTYQKGDLKPIWQSYQSALNIQVNDVWPQTGTTLTDCATKGLGNYDLIGAGSVAEIQTQVDAGNLLDLSKYLEYMPNLRQFLRENALAELGTLANAQTGSIYYSPYYAGMNDAERFNLFRTDYVSELLDNATDYNKNGGTITFKAQADKKIELKVSGRQGDDETIDGTKGSVEAYMGQTGSWTVATTDPADILKTVTVKVDYDAALAAAKNDTTPLGKAIKDGAGKAYNGTSGNIVDLQNFVINEKAGEVKGEHLLNVLRAYIDVAYKWQDGSEWKQFYNTTVHNVKTTRGDVFNSNYAAWDVDLYAAIGRVFVTCGNVLGKYQAQTSEYTNYGASTWLLTTRTGKLDRLTRQTAMIGELYGVRGMEGMTYLDSSGTLRQARFNVSTWDAFQKFAAFHTEGLVPSFYDASVADTRVDGTAGNQSYYKDNAKYQALSSNDFIHTQAVQTVPTGADKAEDAKKYGETKDGYCWTGVATPVSKWLTNDTSKVSDTGAITVDTDGLLKDRPANKTTIMRFTESALKLKTGGLVIPKVLENDQNRLHATLALMDYIYSNDGQIVTTFGDRSDTDNLTGDATNGYTTTNNGWWYGKPVTTLTIDGVATDVSSMSMADLAKKGVVVSYDGGKQYTMTEKYQAYALVYKNKLYTTGTNGGDYDNGYVYQGKMTPYYTRAVHALVNKNTVNGYKHTEKAAYSSTNLQNLLLGAESHGIINNASMVQLCLPMALKGFDIISVTLGNGSAKTVSQAITDNPWYTCAPSVTLPKTSSDIINSYTDFTNLFATKAGGALISNYLFTEVAWYGTNAKLDSWSLSDSVTK